MEQNFQTSFIPKRPIIETNTKSTKPVGLFVVLSVLMFIAVGVGYGGLYFYKGILEKSLAQKQIDLKKAEGRFEVDKIKLLKNLDKKLIASKEVLGSHIALSPIFNELQKITMKTVRYTNFTYDLSEIKNQKVDIKLQGTAVGYRSVALQSDLFAKDKNFIDPIFSNLVLDDKGNVSFDIVFSVDSTFVNFGQVLKTQDAVGINNINTNSSSEIRGVVEDNN
ncbi:MAG: hypothetical protein M3P22_00260 [bacterium]|nr:hypothetical protein [bacterium]